MKKDLQTNYSKDIEPSSITPKKIFEQRRQLIQMAALGAFGLSDMSFFSRQAFASTGTKLPSKMNPSFFLPDKLTIKMSLLITTFMSLALIKQILRAMRILLKLDLGLLVLRA